MSITQEFINAKRSSPLDKHKKLAVSQQVLPSQPVLRCCTLAPYVPLPGMGSASVPAVRLLIFMFSKPLGSVSPNKQILQL